MQIDLTQRAQVWAGSIGRGLDKSPGGLGSQTTAAILTVRNEQNKLVDRVVIDYRSELRNGRFHEVCDWDAIAQATAALCVDYPNATLESPRLLHLMDPA